MPVSEHRALKEEASDACHEEGRACEHAEVPEPEAIRQIGEVVVEGEGAEERVDGEGRQQEVGAREEREERPQAAQANGDGASRAKA